jgi:hypothetical protein
MFKINHKPRFVRTVTVQVPDGETYRAETFSATFEMQDADAGAESEMDGDLKQRAFLERAIVDLGDIADNDDQPIPFTPELRTAVIRRIDCRAPLIRAYFEGLSQAATGN